MCLATPLSTRFHACSFPLFFALFRFRVEQSASVVSKLNRAMHKLAIFAFAALLGISRNCCRAIQFFFFKSARGTETSRLKAFPRSSVFCFSNGNVDEESSNRGRTARDGRLCGKIFIVKLFSLSLSLSPPASYERRSYILEYLGFADDRRHRAILLGLEDSYGIRGNANLRLPGRWLTRWSWY